MDITTRKSSSSRWSRTAFRVADAIGDLMAEQFDDRVFTVGAPRGHAVDWRILLSESAVPLGVVVNAKQGSVRGVDELRIGFAKTDFGLILPTARNAAIDFRRSLDGGVAVHDRLASDLYERLGALMAERDSLTHRLAEALGNLEAAERRADVLEAELKALRAAQAEPDKLTRVSMLQGISAVVVATLSLGGVGLGGYMAGDSSAEVARINQETELTKVAWATAGADGSYDDLDELTAKALETAVRLRDCPAE